MSSVEPILGTWKLAIAKSKISTAMLAAMKQSAPKEQMNTIQELNPSELELTIVRVRVDGSFTSFKATFPLQGGILKPSTPLPEGTSSILTVFDPGNWFFTTLQNGKQVRVTSIIISKDGKKIRETTKGADALGKPYEQIQIFDRQ